MLDDARLNLSQSIFVSIAKIVLVLRGSVYLHCTSKHKKPVFQGLK